MLLARFPYQKCARNPPAFNSCRRLQHFWDPCLLLNPASILKGDELLQGVFSISGGSYQEFLQLFYSRARFFSIRSSPWLFCSCSLGRLLVDWRSCVEWWGLIVAVARKEHLWRAASTKYKGHRRLYSTPSYSIAIRSAIVTCLYKKLGNLD